MFQVTLQEIDAVCTKFNAPTLSQYLLDTGNLFAIASFDKLINISPMDGENAPKLMKFIAEETNLHEGTTAGYGHHTMILEKPVDVFVFQEFLLESDVSSLRELLILHEFCHLLDKQGYFQKIGHVLNQKDLAVGKELSRLANYIDLRTGGWGEDNDHNVNFGGILAHYLILFNPEEWHLLLDDAMSQNFRGNYPEKYLEAFNSVD